MRSIDQIDDDERVGRFEHKIVLGLRTVYPFGVMLAGDTFLFPRRMTMMKALRVCGDASRRLKRKFIVRRTRSGIRCWRVDAEWRERIEDEYGKGYGRKYPWNELSKGEEFKFYGNAKTMRRLSSKAGLRLGGTFEVRGNKVRRIK